MKPASLKHWARAGIVLGCALVGATGLRSQAHAQAWLPDRNYSEGPGIRVGDLELHPGVVVRGGYDNNVFRADGENQEREDSAILAVTPHLNISTLGRQRRSQGEDRDSELSLPALTFRGGLSATYFHYFVEGGPKNIEFDTDMMLGILPQRPVNFDVGISFLRSIRPFAQRRVIDDALIEKDYVFDIISPIARLNFGSRSKVLTGYVGYQPRVTIFESDVFNYLNNIQHGILAGAGWRFLPSTALVYDAQLDLQRYNDDFDTTNSPVVFSDNMRLRMRLGLNGALTRRITFRALAGYAAGFFDDGLLDDFEAPVGEASLSFRFGGAGAGNFTLGYLRDVQSSSMGGWVRLDRGSVGLSALIGGVFALGLEGGVAYVTYGRLAGRTAPISSPPGVVTPIAPTRNVTGLGEGNDYDRNDTRLDGAVHAEYRATNWLAFTGDFSVQTILTDFDYAREVQGSAVPDPADFTAFSAFGGVRFHY